MSRQWRLTAAGRATLAMTALAMTLGSVPAATKSHPAAQNRGAAPQRTPPSRPSPPPPTPATLAARLSPHRRPPRPADGPASTFAIAAELQGLLFPQDAALHFERFVLRFPGHALARVALGRAIALRAGLAEASALVGNVRRFVRLFGKQHPRAAARAVWAVVVHFANNGPETQHLAWLSLYLRVHARHGDVDRRLAALAWLGERHWKASCPVPETAWLCLQRQRAPAHPPRAFDPAVPLLPRNPRLVALAKHYFARVLAVWAEGRALDTVPRNDPAAQRIIAEARHYAAQAVFMQAEMQLEAFIRKNRPRFLGAGSRHPKGERSSRERLYAWLRVLLPRMARFQIDYLNVVMKVRVRSRGRSLGDPHWSIAAVARTADLEDLIANRLMAQPRRIRGQAARAEKTHAKWLRPYHLAMQSRLKARLEICVKLAKDLRWWNEWSEGCSRRLWEIAPRRYPRLRERLPRQGRHGITLDRAGFR